MNRGTQLIEVQNSDMMMQNGVSNQLLSQINQQGNERRYYAYLEQMVRLYVNLTKEHIVILFRIVMECLFSMYLVVELCLFLSAIVQQSNDNNFIILNSTTIIVDSIYIWYIVYKANIMLRKLFRIWKQIQWMQFSHDQQLDRCLFIAFNSNRIQNTIEACIYNLLFLQFIYGQAVILNEIIDNNFNIEFSVQQAANIIYLCIKCVVLFGFIIYRVVYRLILKKHHQISMQANQFVESDYQLHNPINNLQVERVNIGFLTMNCEIDCIICLQPFTLEEDYIKLPCHSNHIYHKLCLAEWLNQNTSCPQCRQEV